MSEGKLTDLVAPLMTLFDDNLRKRGQVRGWGQFVAAESHADQIGLYGTSAGILVKTIANPASHIDGGVVAYVQDAWSNKNDPTSKYFHQNIRLIFFLLSIACTAETSLAAIRAQATDELIARQLRDGGWGDWWLSQSDSDPSPRLVTTAWAILALARLNDARYIDQLRKAGKYLQQNVIGYTGVEKVDPILLCAIVQAMPAREVDRHVTSAAVNLLRNTRPQNDVNIYFFDYLLGPQSRRQVKRDFLCVPAFLSYCLLSSAIELNARFSMAPILVAVAHERSIEHLKTLSKSLPFRNPGSKFPATVDQAFFALALEAASKRKVRFSAFLKLVRWVRDRFLNSWITRVVLPILAATLLAAAAKDPNLIWQLYEWVTEAHAKEVRGWVDAYNSLIQTSALGISFFVGNPLILNIKAFIQKKLRF